MLGPARQVLLATERRLAVQTQLLLSLLQKGLASPVLRTPVDPLLEETARVPMDLQMLSDRQIIERLKTTYYPLWCACPALQLANPFLRMPA